MENKCCKCGETISNDEVAITKKLINRGTDKFFCIKCLANSFGVKELDIIEKIKQFKQMGCTLFVNK